MWLANIACVFMSIGVHMSERAIELHDAEAPSSFPEFIPRSLHSALAEVNKSVIAGGGTFRVTKKGIHLTPIVHGFYDLERSINARSAYSKGDLPLDVLPIASCFVEGWIGVALDQSQVGKVYFAHVPVRLRLSSDDDVRFPHAFFDGQGYIWELHELAPSLPEFLDLLKPAQYILIKESEVNPILLAAGNGDVKTLADLIKHGHDVNAMSSVSPKLSPMFVAAGARRHRLMSFLLDQNADVKQTDKWGSTLLFFADYPFIKKLVDRGCNVEQINSWGASAIFDQSMMPFDRTRELEILKAAGCPYLGIKDMHGRSLLDCHKQLPSSSKPHPKNTEWVIAHCKPE